MGRQLGWRWNGPLELLNFTSDRPLANPPPAILMPTPPTSLTPTALYEQDYNQLARADDRLAAGWPLASWSNERDRLAKFNHRVRRDESARTTAIAQ